ncbi:tannase/feruloyl esterase family alpha/beta hydrolase [Acidobacteria bacterium AH-259-D05]|nr:tannase/feruloyl esterase family alpha/beta hydrolase [Acidobacteria bacterium AH-259-D05]
MAQKVLSISILCLIWVVVQTVSVLRAQPDSSAQAACEALTQVRNLTLTYAKLVEATDSVPQYCYVRGIISPAIHYHAQLPLPENWNGRFLNWGDGGKDGDLDYADHRVAQGYAVANSNTGHDNGSEPRASFGFRNRQAEIDFGYRAVHLTVNAAQTVIKAYYGKGAQYSYHEGCSTGGMQGLKEAQRFPYDFDGIVVGDPVNFYQALNISHVWKLQRVFKNNFEGMLAYDSDGDGMFESLTKLRMLARAVLDKCDAQDGIIDGVIDDPLACDFDPDQDLAGMMCPGDVNADECLTRAQLQTVKDFYSGPYDSKGVSILKGKSFGSELEWARRYIPHPGNSGFPSQIGTSGDHINFLFYDTDPGIPPPDLLDLSYRPDATKELPEWAWWNFNIDDFTAGRGDVMKSITDATDPDLTRFLIKNGGKLLVYHGWADPSPPPAVTIDYYKDVVATMFAGNMDAAREHVRLFMIPGMGHCRGGPGPNEWDKLAPLVEWVEKGKAPDHLVATHRTNDVVDNERKVCAYPQRAVYTGPAGGENNPANWVDKNFTCR